MTSGYDVVVLAGGRSTRYGSDKLALLLDVVLAGIAPDRRVVCVGAPRPTARTGVVWTRETPPFSGPLSAVAAGVTHTSAPTVVLVGGDMPRVGLAVPALVAVVTATGRPAALVDAAGVQQPLASAWPRDFLTTSLDSLRPLEGRPVRLLLATSAAGVESVADPWDAAHDVDVPTEESYPE